jgi:hypothetical protein
MRYLSRPAVFCRSFWLPALLILGPAAYAQTAAQKALAKEPEFVQMMGLAQDNTDRQNLPDNDKPGAAVSAVLSIQTLRANRGLLRGLEYRLQGETFDCHFCAAKQGELSELIRQEVAMDAMSSDALSGTGLGGSVGAMLGLTGSTPDYWHSLDEAREEIFAMSRGHCDLAFQQAPGDIHSTEGMRSVSELNDSIAAWRRADSAYHRRMRCTFAAKKTVDIDGKAHEKAWSSCFNRHDWVKSADQRVPYENCMLQEDKFTKLCAADPKYPKDPGKWCTTHTTLVTAGDVDWLRVPRNRWPATP